MRGGGSVWTVSGALGAGPRPEVGPPPIYIFIKRSKARTYLSGGSSVACVVQECASKRPRGGCCPPRGLYPATTWLLRRRGPSAVDLDRDRHINGTKASNSRYTSRLRTRERGEGGSLEKKLARGDPSAILKKRFKYSQKRGVGHPKHTSSRSKSPRLPRWLLLTGSST